MKLVSKNIDKDGKGSVALVPENTEDMWHAYNIISEGDLVSCSTFRKVQMESATGSSNSYRVRTTLTISVENIDFDTQACVLRLKGRNVEENKYVKMGAYHTLDVEQNRKFTITKVKWDSISLDRVDTACDPAQNADVAAAIMQDGIAHICLITSNMTIVRAKIDQVIPRKRKGNVSQHEKGLARFYESIMQGILRHINFDLVKCVILASPGFVKDQFMDYMIQQAVKSDNKVILENKSKFLLVHASSGFKHSLKEVLADPAVVSRISDTKAAGEVRALETFYTTLQMDPARAFYGKKHVEKANAAQAVETLLISDKLFRCQDIALRKEYVELVENVKDSGGDVKIFSSLHVSGEQLDQLTGIAALLRFPMPELEDESDEGSNSEGKKKYQSGEGAQFITRRAALRKLQLTLNDFRKLCILKGIYPREPRNRKRAQKGEPGIKTLYHKKDIQFLMHEPIIWKLRDYKIFNRKIGRAKAMKDFAKVKRYLSNHPTLKLDHIVKERYPTFIDALHDLDDCLTLCFLFSTFPSLPHIPRDQSLLCRRLTIEFLHAIIYAKALRKVFISIKGYYYQAEIKGQTITWIVPHHFCFEPQAKNEVDFKIMSTFVEFYIVMLGFVNYRLYHTLNLYYPPKLTNTGNNEKILVDEEAYVSERISALNVSLVSLDPSIPAVEDDEVEIDQFSSEMDATKIEAARIEAEKIQKLKNLFKGIKVFINREVPREPLVFILRCFGGEVSWDKLLFVGATFDENDETITHQIIDRPSMNKQYVSRYYIQPQWIFDSVNARELLPVEKYLMGAILPPHLSPFTDNRHDQTYIPPEERALMDPNYKLDNLEADSDEVGSVDNENEQEEIEVQNDLSSGSDNDDDDDDNDNDDGDDDDDDNVQIVEEEKNKKGKQAQLEKKKKMKVQAGEITKENPRKKIKRENVNKNKNEQEEIEVQNDISSGSDEKGDNDNDNVLVEEEEKNKKKKQAQLEKRKKMKVQAGEIIKENPWEKAKREKQEFRLREKMIKKKHRKLYRSMMKGREERAKEIWLLRKKRRIHDTKEKEKRKEQRKQLNKTKPVKV